MKNLNKNSNKNVINIHINGDGSKSKSKKKKGKSKQKPGSRRKGGDVITNVYPHNVNNPAQFIPPCLQWDCLPICPHHHHKPHLYHPLPSITIDHKKHPV